MNKQYKKREDESLGQWSERIAAACQGRSLAEVCEMIAEVSKTSYLIGHLAGARAATAAKTQKIISTIREDNG